MRNVQIIWDLDDDPDGNVQHIGEHGLTRAEVNEVVCDSGNPFDVSHSSGNPAVFGWTSTGRHIIVIFEHVQDDPLTIYPLTAYDVPPKGTKRRRK